MPIFALQPFLSMLYSPHICFVPQCDHSRGIVWPGLHVKWDVFSNVILLAPHWGPLHQGEHGPLDWTAITCVLGAGEHKDMDLAGPVSSPVKDAALSPLHTECRVCASLGCHVITAQVWWSAVNRTWTCHLANEGRWPRQLPVGFMQAVNFNLRTKLK